MQQRSVSNAIGAIHAPWADFERYSKEPAPQKLKGAWEAATSSIF